MRLLHEENSEQLGFRDNQLCLGDWYGWVGLGFGVTLDLCCHGNGPHHALWMFIEIQHQLPDDGWGGGGGVHAMCERMRVDCMCARTQHVWVYQRLRI